MAKIYGNVTELIGGTPILHAKNYEQKRNFNAKLYTKLEYFNPAGSVKDRIANAMISDAEEKGLLKEGSVIIECEVPKDKTVVYRFSDGKIRTSELRVLREVPLEELGAYGKIVAKKRKKGGAE